MIAATAAVCLTVLAGPARSAAAERVAETPRARSGASLSAALASGQSVDLTRAVINGDVILAAGQEVAGVFACSRCAIHGSVRAAGVTFDDQVNLTGSRIRGGLDMTG